MNMEKTIEWIIAVDDALKRMKVVEE